MRTQRVRARPRTTRGAALQRAGDAEMRRWGLPSTLPLLAAASAADDQLVGLLVLAARALAERRHSPRGDRVAAAFRLALTAAVRVVDRVHRRAAHRRA